MRVIENGCFSPDIFSSQDLQAIRRVPKADLHAHAVLSAPFATYQRLSSKKLSAAPEKFANFSEFQRYLRQYLFQYLNSLNNLVLVVHDAIEFMLSDGVVYTELSLDLSIAQGLKISWLEISKPFIDLKANFKDRIKVSFELGMNRDCPSELWKKSLDCALDTELFDGVDLYGYEDFAEVEQFAQFFASARQRGLRVKFHCAEQCQGQRIYHELYSVKADGIQHGVMAITDQQALDYLVKTQTPVHVCPASNLSLSLFPSLSEHPIKQLYDRGVRVTIGTDDYTIFGQSLSEQYLALYNAGLFTQAELEAIRLNGLAQAHI